MDLFILAFCAIFIGIIGYFIYGIYVSLIKKNPYAKTEHSGKIYNPYNTVEKETKTKDQILDECVDELVSIYTRNPGGFLSDSPSAKPVKDIGRKLNDAGGMDLMLRAHEIFSAKITGIGLARNLEMVWDGIGSWRG